jgi:hypothetical protein
LTLLSVKTLSCAKSSPVDENKGLNPDEGGKLVGCAEDLRREKFTNLLHFGAELWENEVVWRTGVQKCI